MESPPRKMNTILYPSEFDFSKIALSASCRSANISCCRMYVKFLRMRDGCHCILFSLTLKKTLKTTLARF